MLLTLKNEQICLIVDTKGAEIKGLKTADGIEYIWQGDPAFWNESSPLLFPFVARLTDNSYKYNGKVYPMRIHGFASSSEFTLAEEKQNMIVLELRDSAEIYKNYPFSFSLKIIYTLSGNMVKITYEVQNIGENTMHFGIGGHPGFNVPLAENERFEDYELEFNTCCLPDRVGFSPALYINGIDEPYPLEDGKIIRLRHDMFDEDAIVLKNAAREITLRSAVSGRGVRVVYPDMPYLGLWHCPKKAAPYICIEPWSSLPARQGIVEEITCRSDFVHLKASEYYKTEWSVTVF